MLIDVEKLSPETPLRADLCIVGGGAAGLALCYALRSTPCSIIVVDSGDMNNDQESRKFLAGSNIGQHPFNLGGQRRRLGGGMNDWGGNCSLLDPDDFTSGNIHTPQWPLSFSELARHSSQVEAFLRLDTRFSAGALAATSQAAHVTLPSPPWWRKKYGLLEKTFLRSDVKLPAAHLDEIETACRNIRIITRATVSELEISPEGTAVTGVTAFSGTHRIAIAAGKVVLASGLENAPILMRAVGEPSDDREHRLPALGRFLHTHLLSLRGFFVPRSDSLSFRQWALPGDLGEEFAHGRDTFYGLQVAQAQRERKKMLNGVMFLSPVMGGGETDLS